MKEFDWDSFGKEKIAVHCKTEDEARDFCRESEKHGYNWRSGDRLTKFTYWDKYSEDTCFTGHGYCSLDYFKRWGYTVLEWADYMPETEAKPKFKVGDRVRARGVVDGVDLAGECGTVICREDNPHLLYDVGVEFDEPFERGYGCGGNGKDGHCWFVKDKNLELIEQPSPKPLADISDGIIRRVDDLGRVSIPKEIKAAAGITYFDKVKVSFNKFTKEITIRKYDTKEWIDEHYIAFTKDKSVLSGHFECGNKATTFVYSKLTTDKRVGRADKNPKDKNNYKTGLAIAYARYKGEEVPKEI